MAEKNFPAVSIIVPMYNVEKFIGECLDSIFAQTFKDYELLVVDDCSTDKSCSIVESYISKFEGRLNLIKSEKNSGGRPGLPRNIAIDIARGEYIMFVDSDDLITNTALEELYTAAKKFDADVVSCESYYQIGMDEKLSETDTKNLKVAGGSVGSPVLMINDFEKRVPMLQNRKLNWSVWTKLIRRDMLMKKNITMVGVAALAEDMIFSYCLICSAERYVLLPNIVNLYRIIGRKSRTEPPNKSGVFRWVKMFIDAFNYTEEFLNSQKFFQNNPDAKFAIFEAFAQEFTKYLLNLYLQIPFHQIDNKTRAEFEKFYGRF